MNSSNNNRRKGATVESLKRRYGPLLLSGGYIFKSGSEREKFYVGHDGRGETLGILKADVTTLMMAGLVAVADEGRCVMTDETRQRWGDVAELLPRPISLGLTGVVDVLVPSELDEATVRDALKRHIVEDILGGLLTVYVDGKAYRVEVTDASFH